VTLEDDGDGDGDDDDEEGDDEDEDEDDAEDDEDDSDTAFGSLQCSQRPSTVLSGYTRWIRRLLRAPLHAG
jgi:hypothetical protein